MTTKDFNIILNNRTEKICSVLEKKGIEYTPGEDRLHSFNETARRRKISSALALRGMMDKHILSVDDMIDGKVNITKELIDEKLGDYINYLILLEAVLYEENNIMPEAIIIRELPSIQARIRNGRIEITIELQDSRVISYETELEAFQSFMEEYHAKKAIQS